jgi:hypothetical protein
MTDEEINPQSLERIARYLDGEQIALGPQEQLLASRIDCDQRALAGELDKVDVPHGMMDGIRRRTRAAAVVPMHRWFKVVSWSTAAAAVLVAAILIWQGMHPLVAPGEQPIATADPISRQVENVAENESDKVALVSLMTMDNEDLKVAIEQTSLENALTGE